MTSHVRSFARTSWLSVSCVVLCLAGACPRPALAAGPQEGAREEIALDTNIISATIYSRQAQIVRRGEVQVQPGPIRLVCDDLPQGFIDTSLHVEGTGIDGGRIIGIDLRRREPSEVDSPRYRQLSDELEELAAERARLRTKRDALGERRQLAHSLARLSIEQGQQRIAEGKFSAEDWSGILAFFEAEEFEREARRKEIEDEISNLSDRISWLKDELRRMGTGRGPDKEVVIDCELPAAGTLTIEISYLVPDAEWHPEYSVRYIEPDNEIELTYGARISQATGEDWENVPVVLSTATPHLGAAPPELSPHFLGTTTGTLRGRVTDATTGEPLAATEVALSEANLKATTAEDGTYVIDSIPAGTYTATVAKTGYDRGVRRAIRIVAGRVEREDFALRPLAAEQVTAAAGRGLPESETTSTRRVVTSRSVVEVPEVTTRGGVGGAWKAASESPPSLSHAEAEMTGSRFAATLVIPKALDLETGGEPRRSLVLRERFPGRFVLETVPRLSDHVFIKGSFHNRLDVPLLPGPIEVYVETVAGEEMAEISNFVGRERLDGVAPGQEFTMYFGVDQNVKVHHELAKKEVLSRARSRTKRVRYTYVTTLESFRRDTAEIRVVDRVPVSMMKEIRVEDVRMVPEPDEQSEDGLVTWTVQIGPGQRKTFLIEYTVEYPSYMRAHDVALEE